MNPELLQWFIPVAGLLAVAFAIYLARDVLSRDTGTKEMMEVSATINEGAVAFIKRQYSDHRRARSRGRRGHLR